MNLVILGPQGSGKGTQAELLVEKFGFSHIETGKILRRISVSEHKWGNRIRQMMLKGVLVSDNILMAVLKEEMARPHPRGFLFDGTPRNIAQYNLIKETLVNMGEMLDKVIYLNISESETVRRLSARRTCKMCGKIYNLITDPPVSKDRCECGGELSQREDDTPEAIQKRLEAFKKSTGKVIEEANKNGILIEVDGERPIEEIHKEIVNKLEL